ncbi:MAG: serpin family protein [Verrucomicrobiia bacterium]
MASAVSGSQQTGRELNAFGLRLMAELGESGSNCVLSPFSIAVALAMAEEGAVGDTAAEIRAALDFTERSSSSLKELSQAFEASLETASPKASTAYNAESTSPQDGVQLLLMTANRLFADVRFPLSAGFVRSMDEMFGAKPERLSFSSNVEAARATINRWVEQQTAERIQDLIPEGGVTVDTALVLVNALFFKAAWLSGFDASQTQPRPFTLDNKETVEVPMLNGTKKAGYQADETLRVLALPYVGGDFELLIILPAEDSSLDAIVPQITGEFLSTAATGATVDVAITLPKIEMRSPSLKLSGALQRLGVESAFDIPPGAADFSPMFEPGTDRTGVEEVYHKTFLLIDEEGSEAAAATAVVIGRLSMPAPDEGPVHFVVDRPFFFAIRHRPTGAALFLGRIFDPRGL